MSSRSLQCSIGQYCAALQSPEVNLFDVHRVVLSENPLGPFDQPGHRPLCHIILQFTSRNQEIPDHLEHVLFAGLPDEFVLVLHQLGSDVLRPAALGVVHACLHNLLGVGVHVGVRL